MASTLTVQQVADYARSYPELSPIFPVSGWTQEPTLSIANDTLQMFLQEGMNWKFNSAQVTPFLTVSLQQDYVGVSQLYKTGSILNMSWLEHATWVDINNTSIPKPERDMEVKRSLDLTSYQGIPFKAAWIPIGLATFGLWLPNTYYPAGTGNGITQALPSPIQQFVDANGNFLFISAYGSTSYSGSSQPVLPANSAPGTTVVDGSLTWTVANPLGKAIRLWPIPPISGLVWQIIVRYQLIPPMLTSLQNTFAPIPDEYAHLIRAGFIAMAKNHANPGSKAAVLALQMWTDQLQRTLRSGDREEQDASMYPSDSLSNSGYMYGNIGPCWPYRY